MSKIEQDDIREERIAMEAVVDCIEANKLFPFLSSWRRQDRLWQVTNRYQVVINNKILDDYN